MPPELLLGRDLGELLIVSNGGNTEAAALGDVEHGIGVLGVPLVIVLGHENCGVVAAAVEVVGRNAAAPPAPVSRWGRASATVIAARSAPGRARGCPSP
jgi:carbonic anhydrase